MQQNVEVYTDHPLSNFLIESNQTSALKYNFHYETRENNTDDSFDILREFIDLTKSIATRTVEVKRPIIIDDLIEKIYKEAIDEIFEDGVKSIFVQKLMNAVELFNEYAIEYLRIIFSNNQLNPELVAETLRWLGDINQQSTYGARFRLLIKCLLNSSPRIRDGAMLGLAYLNDPSAIPYLHKAAENEKILELKDDIYKVIDVLERSSL